MSFIKYSVILLFFLVEKAALFAQAKDVHFQHVSSIPVQARFFTTDKLQQIYVVTPDNQVVKLDPQGNELFRFTNRTLGNLGLLDATDPFNILLFYPDYFTLLFLDRTMNKTQEISLFDKDLQQIQAIGVSTDNQLWLYDSNTFKLKKLTTRGDITLESGDLSLLIGKPIQPNFILERENFVFVNDPTLGILVFDLFGQYLKTIAIKDLEQFQVLNQQLFYVELGELHIFDLNSLLDRSLPLPLPAEKLVHARIQTNQLYLLLENSLEIYIF